MAQLRTGSVPNELLNDRSREVPPPRAKGAAAVATAAAAAAAAASRAGAVHVPSLPAPQSLPSSASDIARTVHLVTTGGDRERRFRAQDALSQPGAPSVVVHGRFDGASIGSRPGALDHLRSLGITIGDARPTDGEVGCTLAHLHVWRHVASLFDDGVWAIVCEDDARLSTDFVRRVEDIAATLHSDARSREVPVEFVYLFCSDPVLRDGCMRQRASAGQTLVTAKFGIELFEPRPLYGAVAYMLTPPAARILLSNMVSPDGGLIWLAADDVTWLSYLSFGEDQTSKPTPIDHNQSSFSATAEVRSRTEKSLSRSTFEQRWRKVAGYYGNAAQRLHDESRQRFAALACTQALVGLASVRSTTAEPAFTIADALTQLQL